MKLKEYLEQERVNDSRVECWEETLMIPTYEIGEYEKNPIFLEKRVYQGSSGSVYPYPVVESVSDVKKDKAWRALFLENRYIKVMILPELGGRIQKAYDKIKKRDFVYYNQVIKPALVGLTGPWISGGIEFNWPQHHRPSTFLPIESNLVRNADGSCSILLNELERMYGSKALMNVTLHPDTAHIEIQVKLYNGTPLPQTFLWWANPAVKVNEHYQSVFPPDVNAVFDHGKRDVSTFPIATGTYYKVDYSKGVDISRYKNIPVPTSYMAVGSEFDFVGGYENDSKGGLLHVASHYVSPGKKQWTWGYGDFGRAWDRNLTDEDGPYIELMTGVFTDNQPDFSWLQPYEEKSFTQYFMPYHELGVLSNATKDALIKVIVDSHKMDVMVGVTHPIEQATIEIRFQGKTHRKWIDRLSPETTWTKSISDESIRLDECELHVSDAEGNLLVEYLPPKQEEKKIPSPAQAAELPEHIKSIEQLFLTGQHLEQYRHATYRPEDYYNEALHREPGDARCNNAMGVLALRKGNFTEAESYFRQAIKTLTQRNPNPYDSEPLYHLGLALQYQHRFEEAYSYFYKSTWSAAMQDAAFLSLARIDTFYGRYALALEHCEQSLIRNSHNHKTRVLKSALLRLLGREDEARAWNQESLHIDSFNVGAKMELFLLSNDEGFKIEIIAQLKQTERSYLSYAFDYLWAGLYKEASLLLTWAIENGSSYPMFYYALGYASEGDAALRYRKLAETMPPDYCFINTIDEVLLLQSAINNLHHAPRAYYYLGNFFYAKRNYDRAIDCWEHSIEQDAQFATAHRNVALAYYNKKHRPQEALREMERAFELNSSDARIFMELDQLYKKLNRPIEERLQRLSSHFDLVEKRDDLYIEYVSLLNLSGEYLQAQKAIAQRIFHPWEGGEGKITAQYLICQVELAKKALSERHPQEALRLLTEARTYPVALGEGKLPNAAENDLNYWSGIAAENIGDSHLAQSYFEAAAKGDGHPQTAWYYNDISPDKIYYQGLALRKLGKEAQAEQRFAALLSFGEEHENDCVRIEYFAVSLPDLLIWEEDPSLRNRINCLYLKGLGSLGMNKVETAQHYFDLVKQLDAAHPCRI